ncbi:hypothetical protein [Zavarzinia aquatilis]|uniref:DdrB-like domain-containing protein n=1 Tax=Zavarzinia aquatilis TaxID=2211142 RepID=A0A317ED76_9PROT|nr:hypothetical protein [Zavarzinia aquatilis]PWR24987.1 hypothetical protein DKG74_04250 [Zavarzinia aquatilis]
MTGYTPLVPLGSRIDAMTPADFWQGALTQHYSTGGAIGASLADGFRSSFGLGTIVREGELPAGAPPAVTDVGDSAPLDPGMTREAGGWGPYRLQPDERAAYEARRAAAQPLTEDAWKASPWYREAIRWDSRMNPARAAALAEQWDRDNFRRTLADRTPTFAVQTIASIAGQALDPVNYVPFFGPAAKAAAAAKATAILGNAVAGRVIGTGLVASLDAVANTAAFGFASRQARGALGDDVSFNAMLAELGGAAVIGGVFGGIEGLAGSRAAALELAARRPAAVHAPLNEAVGALATGRDVALSPHAQAAIGEAGRAAGDLTLKPEPPAPSLPPIAARAIRDDVAITPSGRDVPVRYALVEARDLIASHGDDLQVNPRYPAAIQPRDRGRDASRLQVEGIARDLRPELLMEQPQADQGAPIVGADGVVESGNGRVIALRRVLAEGGERAQAYRQALAGRGYPVDGMEAPVLVRLRTSPLDEAGRAAFARDANTRATAAMSATEQALADARNLPDTALNLHEGGALTLGANRAFVRAVMDTIPETERGALLDAKGNLSREGLTRIENLLIARAYGAPDLLALFTEATDHNLRAIAGALLDVAPEWARMRALAATGQIDAAMDVTPRLVDAVRLVRRARAEGRNVAELAQQRDMFGGDLDPVTRAFLRLMFRDDSFIRPVGRDRLAEALAFYVGEAEKTQPGPGLFGEAAQPLRVLETAREKLYGGPARADESDTAEAPPPRPAKGEAGWRITPEEIAAHAPIEPVRLAPEWGDLTSQQRRQQAKDWIDANLRHRNLSNAEMGWSDITVGYKAASKLVSDRHKEDAIRPAVEQEAVRALPELLDRAILIETRADRKKDRNILAVHRLYAPLQLDGRLYRVLLTIKDTTAGRRFYDHRLTEIVEVGAVTTEGGAPSAEGAARLGPSPTSSVSLENLLAGVNFDDAVPVLPDRLSDLAPARDVSYAAPPPPPPDAGAAAAAATTGKPEALTDLAADLGVDPASGAYPEEIEIENLRAEGRLTEEQRALLDEADRAFDQAGASADALEAAIACGKV